MLTLGFRGSLLEYQSVLLSLAQLCLTSDGYVLSNVASK